ncbi:hypothetical protein [Mycolicibacterium fortuitum]|uniref:Uncharacterized protein n=2 Tax=Mycolicibacterium fortuitum TaxID=1766 RepID=A0AAE4VI80_MYCFO|nr:hypothetical protein [Mycolicibacterium fortuitum]MCV7137918.1 hypothetical protein [Mycolicibacterium fortuitum]MDV7194483.1 hypothetical protein [Mycolicibacterium fortuitum]MDV7207887.1 hypothetical protein [Mycolicibacterium fortuitum]MDV7229185.1 hypothetical protein [Mycolicibacterium fortuitum]MDV7260884.1 hypothetical protein [Mycolicibacterium fortuitum]
MTAPLRPAVEEVIRIPIAGPQPYNTLAYIRFAPTNIANEVRPVVPGHLAHVTKISPSPLVISGYNPNDPRQQHVEHSSTAVLTSLFASDDGSFTAAADFIEPTAKIDETGRVVYTWQWAARFDEDLLSFVACITSWVLLYEPRRTPMLPPRNALAALSNRMNTLTAWAPTSTDIPAPKVL